MELLSHTPSPLVPFFHNAREKKKLSPLQVLDIGCAGGVDGIIKNMGNDSSIIGVDLSVTEIDKLKNENVASNTKYYAVKIAPTSERYAQNALSHSWWNNNPWDRLSCTKSIYIRRDKGRYKIPILKL